MAGLDQRTLCSAVAIIIKRAADRNHTAPQLSLRAKPCLIGMSVQLTETVMARRWPCCHLLMPEASGRGIPGLFTVQTEGTSV